MAMIQIFFGNIRDPAGYEQGPCEFFNGFERTEGL